METLREGWTEYERGVIPEGISETSREVVRHAFYSGAIALMVIGETYRARHVNEEEQRAVLEGIVDEIAEFNAGCEVKMLLHVLAGVTR
ncbi:hypothetical protein [Burkholderia pseudomallei]|uniref:hypothetical protein n=1 Tax=Burkholderia pseudomallei TaxID=28450 RepID=UPI00027FC7B5|nr:hypothetical protein [Burkholderia pseudomallei]AFR18443.1 hypothetical protein BPC006_II0511 [Burkholderia pseudomallei BPC006]MBF3683613.1 hypothetical protein [Burkholderia pseudomallei]MBF4119567.1 hypothetical protein [Burkholderia pseudomallei]